MFFLLFAVIIGIALTFLATQNTMGVPVSLVGYQFTNVPLYLIALISLLFGLFVAWLISLFDWASSSLLLHRKDRQVRQTEDEVAKLHKQIQTLEEENEKLRAKPEPTVRTHPEENDENVIDRVRQSFSKA